MPFSFSNFSATAIIVMVAFLALGEIVKAVRHRLNH